jgi:ABC-type nitrate/sulfonate/bicarbonate transport system substrate-binding protein
MLLAVVAVLAAPVSAADTLRVGKASPQAFAFVPLDVGIAEGIFAKYGIEAEPVGLSGSAKIHQAMAADGIDLALASGPDFPFLVNGSPEIAVAALAGTPLYLGIVVPYDSPARVPADLRGKRIGVSTVQSMTAWLAREFARSQGWQPSEITLIGVGAEWPGQIAALKTDQIDGVTQSISLGYQMERAKVARTLVKSSDYVKDFLVHVIFATNRMVKDHPDQVRRFLRGWFETIEVMRTNREETIRVVRTVTLFDQDVEEHEYDMVMPMFSADGKFDPKALAVLGRSFVDLKMLEREPDLTKYYTEAFLP